MASEIGYEFETTRLKGLYEILEVYDDEAEEGSREPHKNYQESANNADFCFY